MAYGVVYGQVGVNKIPLSRTILPIASVNVPGGVAGGGTPNTFTVAELGYHQIDFDLSMSSPTNDTAFTLQLWNVTTNSLIQARNMTAPQQAWASDIYCGFEWQVTNVAHEYAFYIIPNISVALTGFAMLLQDLNFRAVVQEFGGAGVGPGTAGTIPVFTAPGSIGDSIMTQALAVISVAGAVRVDGLDTQTFMEFTDGQNVPVSAANEGRIRYNTATQTFQYSENTGAWTDLSGVGPGTINRIAKFTAADAVGNSGITDSGAGEWTFHDAANQIAAVGLVAAAFSVVDTAGPDVTLRARDANTSGAANLDGGNLILAGGAPTGTGTRGTVQCPVAGAGSMAIGDGALGVNTGDGNVAVGDAALSANTTGTQNTAVGATALATNQTGDDCTAVGYSALNQSTGASNTAVGARALDDVAAGTTNTGVGVNALGIVAGGIGNTALGYQAGLTTGAAINYTVNVGHTANATANYAISAGANATASGAFSVVVGSGDAGVTYANPVASAQGAIAIGPGAQATGASAIAVGPNSSAALADGIAIGEFASASQGNTIAIGYAANADGGAFSECMAIGPNAVADDAYATAVGPYAEARGEQTVSIGTGTSTCVDKTTNICGMDIVPKYSAFKWDALANNVTRLDIICPDQVSLLGTSTVTMTIPAGAHVWIEEVGIILTELSLDGGALTVQPTCSFGITGDNDKYLAPTLMTLLDTLYNRERFSTLLQDNGETSLTMEITVAGTIAGGGGSESYKGRPYWKVWLIEDET